MGVQRLWDLLSAAALPLRVESLRGKKCAIDAGYWVSHCLASESNMRHGGDILGVFFLRICYLLEKGIRPIFIFDGKPPDVKKRTMLKRKLIQDKSQVNHNLLAFKLLKLHLKKFVNSTISERACSPNFENNVSLDKLRNYGDTLGTKNNTTSADTISPITDNIKPEHPDKTDEIVDEIKGDYDIKGLLNDGITTDGYAELSNSAKYCIMNKVRDDCSSENRLKSLKLKDTMSEYSDFQLKSYFKEIAINRELDKIKHDMSDRIYNISVKREPDPSILDHDFHDYNVTNSRKKRKFINTLNEDMVPAQPTVRPQYYFNEMKNNDMVDRTALLSDREIFGDDFFNDISENDEIFNISNFYVIKREIDTKQNNPSDTVGGYLSAFQLPGDTDASYDKGTNHNITGNIIEDDNVVVPLEDEFETIDSLENAAVDDINVERVHYPIDCIIDENAKTPNDYRSTYTNFNMINKLDDADKLYRLLELFGIPFMTAPSESESQCAYLNRSGVCYAVITDDSDTLVFGANRVLKNFYNTNAFELYTSDHIFTRLGLTQTQLALIAIICGCDYTAGVHGIGIVNALEVIKAYPTFNDLYEFRSWATSDCSLETATEDKCPIKQEFKEAHLNYRVNWLFSADFPNKEAYNLFLHPPATSSYHISWKAPNTNEILSFMQLNSSLPLLEIQSCLDSLKTKKTQQFIIEDIIPELHMDNNPISTLKDIRRTLSRNLSAFRKFVSNLGSKRRDKLLNIEPNLSFYRQDPINTKIRSKRLQKSIEHLKKQALQHSSL